MPEWRKIFEAEDSDFGGGGLGAMEVCSSTEMGTPGASHLGTGDHGPKTDRSRPRPVPGNGKLACVNLIWWGILLDGWLTDSRHLNEVFFDTL
jgi:hypothetical protein